MTLGGLDSSLFHHTANIANIASTLTQLQFDITLMFLLVFKAAFS